MGFCIVFTSITMWNTTNWCCLKGTIKKVLQSLHNDLGHQGIDRTLDLLRERVYWPTMTQDANSWVNQCRHCQVAKGNYNTPKPKFGHLITHNPLDLVCLDFTKVDVDKEQVPQMVFSLTHVFLVP